MSKIEIENNFPPLKSSKEVDIYKVPENDGMTRTIYMKLLIVSLICVFFMIGEVIGGLISSSIALLTDAAHMLSDLVGFCISFIAVWLSRRPATERFSFGFHRAEVIGGCASIILIWGLTIWLIAEAADRIYNPEIVDGEVMLITASGGLLANIVMAKVLHHHGHGHGHSHDHHGQGHGIHSHNNEIHSHNHETHNNNHEIHNENQNDENNKNKLHEHHHEEQVQNDNNSKKQNICFTESSKNIRRSAVELVQEGSQKEIDIQCTNKIDLENANQNKIENNNNENQQYFNKNLCDGHNHEQHKKSVHRNHQFKLMRLFSCSKNCKHSSEENTKYVCCLQSEREIIQPEQQHAHENYNIKAAILHVLGDFLQSVAVVIAGIVIYLKPELSLLDPILTFFFSALVILTTLPMMKEFILILMEANPKGIKVKELREMICNVIGLKEIHDFHVWSLTSGKFALSAHLSSDQPNETLKQATVLCRKYGIYHSTIQIEDWNLKGQEDWIKCSHNLH